MEFIIIWLIFGIISAVIASNKGRSGCGWFVIGILLGPIGIILALVTSKNEQKIERTEIDSGQKKRCPKCDELIRADALRCRYCSYDFYENKPSSQNKFCPGCGTAINPRSNSNFCGSCGHKLK